MTTTKTLDHMKAPTVAEAIENYEASRAYLEDLRESLLNGDTSVTAEQIDAARRDVEHAELVVQGAKTRERRESEEKLKADVEQFRAAYPKRLASQFEEMRAYRDKALAALGDYLDAVSELERERARVDAEYRQLAPEHLADQDGNLPRWFVKASPSRDERIPRVDEFKAGVAALVDVLKRRHVGSWRGDQAELLRTLTGYVSAQQSAVANADPTT